jgi:hypothetical protein
VQIFCGVRYFEVGDVVHQDAYPGCPAVVIEVIELRDDETRYRLRIDARGHPEAIDENGDPEPIKYSALPKRDLERANPLPGDDLSECQP